MNLDASSSGRHDHRFSSARQRAARVAAEGPALLRRDLLGRCTQADAINLKKWAAVIRDERRADVAVEQLLSLGLMEPDDECLKQHKSQYDLIVSELESISVEYEDYPSTATFRRTAA